MAAHTFSPKEAMGYGWKTVKKNLSFFAIIMIIVFFASAIPVVYDELIKGRQNAATYSFLINFVFYFIQAGVGLGMILIMLKTVDGKKTTVKDLFAKFNVVLLLKMVATGILYGLIVFVGLLLLVVPGIIFMARFSFSSYPLVEDNVGPFEAMRKSWDMTKGHVTNLIYFGLLSLGVIVLGILAFGVGIIIAQAVISVGSAYIYRKIAGKHTASDKKDVTLVSV